MPDDVGGGPFQDGREPDDDRGADEEFASVVFDEGFVRSATIHEPSAVERLLAAAEARAEAEARRARGHRAAEEERAYGQDDHGDGSDAYWGTGGPGAPSPYGRHGGAMRPYRGSARWHRPVAWIVALLFGIGMVALAYTAVYRGAGEGREDHTPQPASTGADTPRSDEPSGTSGRSKHATPPVSAVPGRS